MKLIPTPKRKEVYIVLCDIRSVFNTASIFRTADCLGVSQILLVGYTPLPVDRFGRPRPDFAKVALGAEKTVAWRYFAFPAAALKFLKRQDVFTIAVEQSPTARDYRLVKAHYPAAFVFGNEIDGVPVAVLKQSDVVAEIPMRGAKESLNVSVAAGIALARILGR